IEGSVLGIQIATLEQGRVFTNHACVELFGYDSLEDLFAIPRWNLVAEYDRKRVTEYRDRLFAGETFPAIYEFDGKRKDGSVVPIQTIMRRLVWQGEDAVQRTFLDLTERKRAEEQLRQAQKMEVVGQLTGGVAHDFNNLLTVVQGNLEMMAVQLKQADMVRLAETALKAAKRGSQLTQRLLAFSRKQTLEPKVIQLDRLIADMSELMRRTLRETVEIEVTTASDLWNCEIDPSQLENAILNLALNARDAMAQGGRLTIKTENAVLDYPKAVLQNVVPAGDYVVVSVADTGTGMSANELEHAFEPFFTTKDVGAGSGLGLSMVHGFISQSDGFVTIDSTKGTGTTVKMYLPKSSVVDVAASQDADTEEPVSRGELVLAVEDDPDLRDFTVMLLESLGYETLEAANGKIAIEVLRTTPGIDLLFTDVVLPGGMSGMDIAREAMELVPGIKILFTSGYADDVLAGHGQTYRNVELISKPFQIGELARHLRAVLDGAPPAPTSE
ncbi:MAG: ATP-binding protein, partial [Alphaproteobacteria bacterium]